MQFRALLSRRAAHAARRLLIDEALLRRLSRLVARAEVRAAQLIQWKWRALHKSRKFRERVALKRVNHAVVRRRASKIVVELERRAQQELAEAKAAIRLQAALRRCVARRHAARAARTKAVGLLKMQWGANREVRAVGRLQRMWLARVAERREREASAQAGKLDQLQLRLAR